MPHVLVGVPACEPTWWQHP